MITGRGKRKNDATDIPMKRQRIEQDLTAIENATTAVIALEKLPIETSPELFRALNQPTLERIIGTSKPTERNRNVEFVEITDNAQTTCTMPPHQVYHHYIGVTSNYFIVVQYTCYVLNKNEKKIRRSRYKPRYMDILPRISHKILQYLKFQTHLYHQSNTKR